MLYLHVYAQNGLRVDLGDAPDNLVLTQKLPGGCDSCEFTVSGTLADRMSELKRPNARVLEVSDDGARVLFKGRLARGIAEADVNHYVYLGYWYSLWDVVWSNVGAPFTSPTKPSGIITTLLSQAAPPGVSPQTTYISTADTADVAAGGDVVYQLQAAGDIIRTALSQSPTDTNQFYAGVFARLDQNGKPFVEYFTRPATPTWFISLDDLGNQWNFELDWESVYSSIRVQYTDPTGTRQTSGIYQDADTQLFLGYDRMYPMVMPENQQFPATSIDAIAGAFLRQYRRPKHRTDQFVVRSGYVQDPGGNEVPSYRVRAGDMLRVMDAPLVRDLPDLSEDDIRNIWIVQTSYEAETGNLTVVGADAPDTMTALVARLALAQNVTNAPTPAAVAPAA